MTWRKLKAYYLPYKWHKRDIEATHEDVIVLATSKSGVAKCVNMDDYYKTKIKIVNYKITSLSLSLELRSEFMMSFIEAKYVAIGDPSVVKATTDKDFMLYVAEDKATQEALYQLFKEQMNNAILWSD